jgi:hypothetical protein
MSPTSQAVVQIIVDLARLALYAYIVQSGRDFLLKFLETRQGLPLFGLPRPMTKNEAIDAARKFGMTESADTK